LILITILLSLKWKKTSSSNLGSERNSWLETVNSSTRTRTARVFREKQLFTEYCNNWLHKCYH